MKKTVQKILALVLIAATLLSVASCGAEKEPEITAAISTEETLAEETTEETVIPEETYPEFMNPYTGLACDEALVGKRPIAIMFNNLREALPQSGLTKCEVLYEVLTEGGILRMCGIILDYENAGQLGTVRSCRPYFVHIATANDAIYVHAGGNGYGYDEIRALGANDIDFGKNGPYNAGGRAVFWRDQSRLNRGVALEHTLFTNGENLAAAVQLREYRTTLNNPKFTAFNFKVKAAPDETGRDVVNVTIPHSSYSVSKFSYNAVDHLYYHSQYDAPHVDGENNQQVATENVFILFADEGIYADQIKTSYRWVNMVGQGTGYYLSEGKCVDIVWKRADSQSPYQYFTKSGEELKVNPGKSYVSIVDNKTADRVELS